MSWNPDEWQRRCMILASRFHKGASGFVEIPDSHQGDGGLEGFSIDGSGIGYQCYVPEDDASTPLTDRLVDKINKDTLKLKRDDKGNYTLLKILGATKLKRWTLLIPQEFFKDKAVIEHANKRSNVVALWNLPFIDSADFRIVVSYGAEFDDIAKELELLGRARISLDDSAVDDTATEDWAAANDQGLSTLDTKLSLLRRPQLAIAELRKDLIRCAVVAQNSIDRIRDDDPEGWEAILKVKSQKSRSLRQECALTDLLPSQFLKSVVNEYQQQLRSLMPALDADAVRIVANEAIVEWLIACPLNFYSNDTNDSQP